METIITGLTDQDRTDHMLGHHIAGDAHVRGHLLVRQAIKTVQYKGLAAARWQAFNRQVNGPRILAEGQHLLGLQVPGCQRLLRLVQRFEALVAAHLLTPVLVRQQVARRAEQQRSLVCHLGARLLHAKEAHIGLLHQISRRVAVLQSAGAEVQQFFVISMRSHSESSPIPCIGIARQVASKMWRPLDL